MSLILIAVISLLGIVSGKLLFKKWVNHLTIYCTIWGVLVLLYELKLIPYPDVIPLAWFFIISAFLSFLFGIITIISTRNIFHRDLFFNKKSNALLNIFIDDGKTIKYFIIIFSVIGIFAGIQHWSVLINLFGSVPAVFLNANKVYRMGIEGEIKGVFPYIYVSGYVAIFFSGMQTAYKGKFSLLTFLPFTGIVIRELAIIGRAGILLALMEFLFTFILFRYLLKDDYLNRFKFSKKNAIVATLILFIFLIASSSFVRIIRAPGGEGYQGATRGLNQLKDNIIISPSIYLYLSSDVGVLNKYLESDGENARFGENTFLPIHALLAKFGVGERPSDFLKGYRIPMWTNTGTFIRELHADFGVAGVFLGPYILGLLTTWLWFKFYKEKNLYAFVFLVYSYLIIGFSFLVMISRLMQWFISLLLIVICIPIIEHIAVRIKTKK